MRFLTARLEDGYCSITVASHRLITVVRFVAKSYTHLLKNFANRFYLVHHACEIFFSKSLRARIVAKQTRPRSSSLLMHAMDRPLPSSTTPRQQDWLSALPFLRSCNVASASSCLPVKWSMHFHLRPAANSTPLMRCHAHPPAGMIPSSRAGPGGACRHRRRRSTPTTSLPPMPCTRTASPSS